MIIPPWLQPTDPVSSYAKGVALGAQLGEQVQRNQREAQALQARAVENERERMLRQAEMEMQFSYRQAQLGLEQRQLEERSARDAQAMELNQQYKQAQMQRMAALTAQEEMPQWGPETVETVDRQKYAVQANQRTGQVRRTPIGQSIAQQDIASREIANKQLKVMDDDIKDKTRELLNLEAMVPPPGVAVKSQELRNAQERYGQLKGEVESAKKARADFLTKMGMPATAAPEPATGEDWEDRGEATETTPPPNGAKKKLTREKAQEYYDKTDSKLSRAQRIAQAQKLAAADGYTED